MSFEDLPQNMQNSFTKKYFEILKRKKLNLFFKRLFDVIISGILIIIFSPILIAVSIAIKIDSRGPVFYRQVRVGQYGKDFKIFKFRSMVQNADKIGLAITVGNDSRITKVGRFVRKYRIDEFAQLFNVFNGTMSMVGPRPEVRKYVDRYEPNYMSTLLIRPGITATSSIKFRHEDDILEKAGGDSEEVYVKQILPIKMKYNLEYLDRINVITDIKIMFQTVYAVVLH